MNLTPEQIARVTHAANAAYSQIINDGIEHKPWDESPESIRAGVIRGVEAKLARPEMSAAEQHGLWLKDKLESGWTYGPVKDVERKQHPNITSYDALTAEQRMKDKIFGAIVHALST